MKQSFHKYCCVKYISKLYKLNSNFKLECFSSHGIHDSVIPISWSRKGIECIKNNNIGITFKEYESGHEINNENLKDLIDWLYRN